MQRAVTAEAKVGLRSSISVRDTDIRCPRDHRPSQNTFAKVQIQGSTTKESKPKESKPKNSKPANEKISTPLRIDELEKTSYQDKKKEYLKKKQNRKNSTPATGDNAIEGENKRNNRDNGKYYNCLKKGHYTRNYLEPPKN